MKKVEKLYDGITEVRDDLVQEAAAHKFRGMKKNQWAVAAVAACLVLALIAGTLMPTSPGEPGDPSTPASPGSLFPKAYALSLPEYAKSADVVDDYESGMEDYLRATIPAFLTGEEAENAACSPLNVYMALAMLTEMTDGETRQQLLDVLGSPNLESVRTSARSLWSANYRDDEMVKRVLGSSLWLNRDYTFRQETLDALAQNYYAASYSGEMGDEDFDRALQNWLNQHTGGLLQEQVSDISLDPDDMMNLYTTVYFRAKWDGGFAESQTVPGIFHSPAGDVECDMMKKSSDTNYYWGDSFTAVSNRFDAGQMWFILPDEGNTVDDLLADGQAMDFMLSLRAWGNVKYLTVHMTVPKFDITIKSQLEEPLKELGVTRVFDPDNADMSPLSDMPAYLSRLTHGVRVKIDEEGCEATAYVEGPTSPGSPPPPDEEVEFILDRPFLFLITGADNLPLFVGVVNQP